MFVRMNESIDPRRGDGSPFLFFPPIVPPMGGLWGTPLPLDQTEYVKNLGLICQISTIIPVPQKLFRRLPQISSYES